MSLKLGTLVAYLRADDTHLARGLAAMDGKMRQAGQKARQYAPIVGAALAAGIGAGFVKGLDLEEAQAKLTNQVGDPALAEKLGKVAGQVYTRGFGESAAENMDAVQAVVSGKLASINDAGAVERMTVQVQAYAKTWGTDVAQAAKYASTVLGSGLVKDAEEAMDLITVASSKVPRELREDVLDAADEYSQFFRTLGFSGEQAFSLLVKGAEKGMYGIDKAGDAIKEFTIRATDMSNTSVNVYEALGLDAETMSNRILKGGTTAKKAFDQIVDGLLSIEDPTERANHAIGLFGTPLEDLNVADIPEFLRSLKGAEGGLGDVSGAAQRAGETLEQTNKQKLEAFKRQVQSALIDKVGQAVPYLEKVGKWALDNAGTLLTIGAVIGGLAVSIYAVRGAIAAWNAITVIWAALTKGAIALQVAWNIAMMASPIGLVVLAIIALVAGIVLLWKNSEDFRVFWTSVWNGIVDWVMWAADKIVAGFWWLVDALVSGAKNWWALFSNVWRKVGDLGAAVWGWISDRGEKFMGWLRGLPRKIGNAAKGAFDGWKWAFRSAINWIIGRWNNLSFRIPGISVPGIGQIWGGATIDTPNLPMLANGGRIIRDGLAVVGERGPELHHFKAGAAVQPLGPGGRLGAAAMELLRIVLTGEFRIRGKDLVLVLRETIADLGGDVQKTVGTNR
ncbi:phage tail protein [Micromonospora zingiberis]|uniref:Phage tail protein n=1 Tax=Micromonospora zingiberis TaxID=2053011 RepID=A0A4V2LWR9_9ACTN|nr:phage tail tape measure protein [Micromonospora zingiberis]TCB97585.1 phage tail protein [Micromonospora zingiberis]